MGIGKEPTAAVTMRDVAERAGVSPTVISHVLNNRAVGVRVSPATAERVRQAAVDLGYRMNVAARNFRKRETQMIGVMHGIGFTRHRFDRGSRYFAALMDGIVDGAFEHGYSVTLCPKLLGDKPEDAMADGRFDGLVWYSAYIDETNRRMLESCNVPLVLIHTPASMFENRFPSVMCDNDQGIGLAVKHLADLGHQRIAFVFGTHDFYGDSVLRRDAFLKHTARLGLNALESDVFDTNDKVGDLDQLLKPRQHTAVICANDSLAAHVIAEAKRLRIRIPRDLSIVGFDSTTFCDSLRPTLTSVFQPLVNMGQSAVDLLVQSINGQAPAPPALTLPCGLDIRGSTTSIASR
jgi:LacI family transcriptional regulator